MALLKQKINILPETGIDLFTDISRGIAVQDDVNLRVRNLRHKTVGQDPVGEQIDAFDPGICNHQIHHRAESGVKHRLTAD